MSNTAKHTPIINAMIPIFVSGSKIGGYGILQLCAYSHSLGTSFELITPKIGPRASLLWLSDFPIKNALQGWKIVAKCGKLSLDFAPNESIYFLGPKICAKFHQNRIKTVTVGARRDRQTEGHLWLYNVSHAMLYQWKQYLEMSLTGRLINCAKQPFWISALFPRHYRAVNWRSLLQNYCPLTELPLWESSDNAGVCGFL